MHSVVRYQFEAIDFGNAPLSDVADVAVDLRGNIHALVRGEYPLLTFDANGRLLRRWGRKLLANPHGLAVDPRDRLLAVDGARHVVLGMNPEGHVELCLGTPGVASDSGTTTGNFKLVRRGAAPFNCPTKVAVGPGGEIFVSDGYGNARVHRFSAEGRLIASWGEPGTGPGQFNLPHGIAIDDVGLVYVADRENERIQVFDARGRLQEIWNDIHRPAAICIKDGMVFVAELGRRMYIDNVLFQPDGTGPYSQVRIFDRAGIPLCCLGGPDPREPGSFYAAHSICVDGQGSIYVGEVRWPEGESPRPLDLRPSLQKFRKMKSLAAG
jgi:DNA-binding beta-propeller fold protein YncE